MRAALVFALLFVTTSAWAGCDGLGCTLEAPAPVCTAGDILVLDGRGLHCETKSIKAGTITMSRGRDDILIGPQDVRVVFSVPQMAMAAALIRHRANAQDSVTGDFMRRAADILDRCVKLANGRDEIDADKCAALK